MCAPSLLLTLSRGACVTSRFRPFVFLSPGTHPPSLYAAYGTGQEVFSTCLSHFNCAPVFLPLSIKDRFYKGMCKQIMWPMFHYVLPMSPTSNARFDPNLWQVISDCQFAPARSNHGSTGCCALIPPPLYLAHKRRRPSV